MMWGGQMHGWTGMMPVLLGLWMLIKAGVVIIGLWLLYRIARALEDMARMKKG